MQPVVAAMVADYFKKNGGAYEIAYSPGPRGSLEIAREHARTGAAVRLYACGGDGTLFDVVNGAYGYPNAQVGMIPCGAGNDFLKYFGGAEKFLDIDAQVKGSAFPMDLIRCGGFYSVNQCSMGMDAEIAASKNHFIRWPFVSGKLAYTLAVFYQFTKKLSSKYRVVIDDGEVLEGEYLFAVAPNANPCDGRLEFVLIDRVGRLRIAGLLGRYRQGTHVKLGICTLRHGGVMEVTAPAPAAVNMDGEIMFMRTARFELVEKGIRFIVPGVSAVECGEREKRAGQRSKLAAPACDYEARR